MARIFLVFLAGYISFATPQTALAGKELVVRGEIEVYAKRNRDSEILTILERGDRVPISPKRYGRWRKVLIKDRGKSRVGYIHRKSLRRAKERFVRRKRKAPVDVYHRQMGAGLQVNFSYLYQGERELGTTQITSQSGLSTFFGFFGDFPMSSTSMLRGKFLLRSNSMTGSASLGTNAASQPLELKQSFLSIGAMNKWYEKPKSNFWFGAGAEFAIGRDVSLLYGDDTPVPVPEEAVPNFFILQGGLGWDLHMSGNFYILPEFILNLIINSSPMMYGLEFNIGTGYRF